MAPVTARLRSLAWWILPFGLALAPGCGQGRPQPLPAQHGMVNDLAGLLEPEAVSSLSASLQQYRAETCHELVVLIVPSLQGETLGQISARAMELWQIGGGPLGNGRLMTLAVEEGSARIDAGPGLEELVRSGFAEKVLRQVLFPRFGEGDYESGLAQGLERIMEEGRGIRFPEELRPPVCR